MLSKIKRTAAPAGDLEDSCCGMRAQILNLETIPTFSRTNWLTVCPTGATEAKKVSALRNIAIIPQVVEKKHPISIQNHDLRCQKWPIKLNFNNERPARD